LSPEHREVTEFMLERARRDLRAAEQLLSVEDRDEAIIGFLLQQAVEKALKAILAANEVEIPLTHNLGRLSAEVVSTGTDLPGSIASVTWLTPWGTTFRYESPSDDLDIESAVEGAAAAIGVAQQVLDENEPGG
jgi:HEPN domain-containing protein